MTLQASENFNALGDGVTVSTVNTAFSDVVGSPTTFTTNPIEGTTSLQLSSGAQTLSYRPAAGDVVLIYRVRIATVGTGNYYLGDIRDTPGGARAANLRLEANGTISIRAGFSLEASSPSGAFTNGDVLYIEHRVTAAATSPGSNPGTQVCYVWKNSNTTPDSPDYAIPSTGTGDADPVGATLGGVGVQTAASSGWDIEVDTIGWADDWERYSEASAPTIPAKVAIIGDSQTFQSGAGEARMETLLVDAGFGANNIYFNAVNGRRYTDVDQSGSNTLEQIQFAKTALGSVDYWLIALGDNGVTDSDASTNTRIGQILDELGAGQVSLWPTLARSLDGTEAQTNQDDVDRRNARMYAIAAARGDQTMIVIDWEGFVHNGRDEDNPELWNETDWLHMTNEGEALRNSFMAAQLTSIAEGGDVTDPVAAASVQINKYVFSVTGAGSSDDVTTEGNLTYAWTGPAGGSFANASQSSTLWTSPDENGPWSLTLTVTDEAGNDTSISVSAVPPVGTGGALTGVLVASSV